MRLSPLHRFITLTGSDRALLMRSVILIGVARLALWVLPFNVARRLLVRPGRARSAPFATTERIGWAISVGKRFVPKGDCLPQALAAESLLVRAGHPVELRVGVAKIADGSLDAHAWVESGGRLVVGDLTQGLSMYTPLPALPPLHTPQR
jgi:hypothetical protein